MANEFQIGLVGSLDKEATKQKVNSDLQSIKDQLKNIKIEAKLDTNVKKNIDSQLKNLSGLKLQINNAVLGKSAIDSIKTQLANTNFKININTATTGGGLNLSGMQSQAQQAGQQIGNALNQGVAQGATMSDSAIKKLEADIVNLTGRMESYANKTKGFREATAQIGNSHVTFTQLIQDLQNIDVRSEGAREKYKLLASQLQALKSNFTQLHPEAQKVEKTITALARTNFSNSIQEWMRRNTKASKQFGDQLLAIKQEALTCNSIRFNELKQQFSNIKAEAGKMNLLGKSLTETLKNGAQKFVEWGFASQMVMTVVNNTKKAAENIKETNDIITEISKTSDMNDRQLKQLASSSYNSASKYGLKNTDYLYGVQEMSRSGFYGQQGEDMAKLSILAQSAGDMTKDVANSYILATNAAYKYAGSVEALNGVLDGQNIITNRNSVDMTTMATATEKAASVAANAGVKINELSAMIGTISARTKEAGEETGTGLKSLLINLQNTTSKKIVATLEEAGAAMTDAAGNLRTPIEILEDLAKTYNSLDEKNPLKSKITTNIGQKYHANQLAALLTGWDDYKKMLQDYSEGAGSAEKEAEKSANNISGSLNKVTNSWNKLIADLSDDKSIINLIDLFRGLLDVLNKVTSTIGLLPSIGLGVGVGALIKNFGKAQSQAFVAEVV